MYLALLPVYSVMRSNRAPVCTWFTILYLVMHNDRASLCAFCSQKVLPFEDHCNQPHTKNERIRGLERVVCSQGITSCQ